MDDVLTSDDREELIRLAEQSQVQGLALRLHQFLSSRGQIAEGLAAIAFQREMTILYPKALQALQDLAQAKLEEEKRKTSEHEDAMRQRSASLQADLENRSMRASAIWGSQGLIVVIAGLLASGGTLLIERMLSSAIP